MTGTNPDLASGVLWGQAIGDALGTTQEFKRPRNVRPFPLLNSDPQTDMVGGGPFGLDPGQVTDDTQMAACLADSLADLGRYDCGDVARRYVEWMSFAFDIGNQTRAALTKIQQGIPASQSGIAVWEAAGRDAAANGSLMRISPLPVFFTGDAAAARRAALADSSITHADPRCQLACAAYCAAIQHRLIGESNDAEAMRRAALVELPLAAQEIDQRIPQDRIQSAVDVLTEDLRLAAEDDPKLDVLRHPGFVRVAFRLAFWELLHAPDFQTAVLDCANRGGDADTNGAIAGALYGALAGASGIHEDWRKKVMNACQGASSVWADKYHPRRLFRVLRQP